MQGGSRTRGIDKSGRPDTPMVSVITPTLNCEQFLEQTIRSVLDQTYDNIEYIIVDGGSTDRTLDIISKYEDRISYWVSEPDNGIYDAMNKGVGLARGDIVGIINSDDWYALDAVEAVVEAYRENQEVDFFFGNMFKLNRHGTVLEMLEGSLKKLFICNTLYHPTCFLRMDIYERHKFNTDCPIAADYELMLKLYLSGTRFHHIDKPLAYFRTGGGSYRLRRSLAQALVVRRKYHIISDYEYFILRFFIPMQAVAVKLKHSIMGAVLKSDRGRTMYRLYRGIKKRTEDHLQ